MKYLVVAFSAIVAAHGGLAGVAVGASPDSPDNDCPVSEALLDVQQFPGPGAGYEKPFVEASCSANEVTVRSNGVPHYEFVQVTPLPLIPQNHVFRIPRNPRRAAKPTAIPLLGAAGFAVNGVSFFGPNEGPVPAVERYGDPIFNSIMDECLGHTANEYHYHAFHQPCLTNGVKEGQRSPVLGYALDGFAIHGPYGCADKECRQVIRMRSSHRKVGDPAINAWDAYRYEEHTGVEFLDRCNGHEAPDGSYHYHATSTFPYIIGCYAGTPTLRRGRGATRVSQGRRGRRTQTTRNRGVARGRTTGGAQSGRGRAGDLAVAAARLGLAEDELSAVIDRTELLAYLRDPENRHFDFAAAARKLRVNEWALRQALEHQVNTPVAYRGHRPGCTVTSEGYLLCHPNAVHGLVEQVQGGRE